MRRYAGLVGTAEGQPDRGWEAIGASFLFVFARAPAERRGPGQARRACGTTHEPAPRELGLVRAHGQLSASAPGTSPSSLARAENLALSLVRSALDTFS